MFDKNNPGMDRFTFDEGGYIHTATEAIFNKLTVAERFVVALWNTKLCPRLLKIEKAVDGYKGDMKGVELAIKAVVAKAEADNAALAKRIAALEKKIEEAKVPVDKWADEGHSH